MKRSQIISWFLGHRDNILRDIYIMSKYCAPEVLPISEEYVYKNILGIKFFMAKKCLVTQPLYYEIDNAPETPEFLESIVNIKKSTIFDEIYFIDYDPGNDSLTFVYAKDVESGCYDACMGVAIDLTKIPKTSISGSLWTFHNDNNIILTLDELFIYKDILQP